MRVLMACEESGRVCTAFREKGHEAFSCDIKPTSGEHPEWHYEGDVRNVLYATWDLVIAFPPCTFLTNAGAQYRHLREREQREAIDFFLLFTKLTCPYAIENPIGIISSVYRKPDQIIHPWQFGHKEKKRTCLWLSKLPPLVPTNIVAREEPVRMPNGKLNSPWYNKGGKNRSCIRSKTFLGIAKAMAEQWG